MKTKKAFLAAAVLAFGAAGFSQSLADAVRAFDAAVFNSPVARASTAVGFINYGDTGTCGSVAPWIRAEIKKTAAATRRICIVDSYAAGRAAQAVVATRGMLPATKKSASGSFMLSGTYYENGENLELFLSLHMDDGRLFAAETALIPLEEIRRRKLTLYPENLARAQQIDEDFSSAESEQSKEASVSVKSAKTTKTIGGTSADMPKKSSFLITAAMLDEQNNLVDILRPNDTVRFMISTEKDSYIALLCIDANGDKNWLPVSNNFVRAGEVRIFPDIAGHVFKVVDGVYGAEQILVYAAESPEGLPEQTNGGMYSSGDILQTARGIIAAKKRSGTDCATTVFKITYTVLP